MSDIEFGDSEPDDAFDALDADQVIDWDQIVTLQQMYDAIDMIENDEWRLEAAKTIVQQLET